MENKKNAKSGQSSWGGKREGAGRKKIAPELKKKTVRKGKVIYFRILDEDYNILEKLAKENNTTVNKYLQNITIDIIKKNNCS